MKSPMNAVARGCKQRPDTSVRPAVCTGAAMSPPKFEVALAPLLPRLHRLCLALTGHLHAADDLLQDSLARAHVRFDSYRGEGELYAWLCAIVRHEFLDQRRRAHRRASLLGRAIDAFTGLFGDAAAIAEPTPPPSPEESVLLGERITQLLAALREVPEDFRVVVVLIDIEDLGYPEVAEIMHLPIGTVKSRHARGRAKLVEAFRRAEEARSSKEGT